MKIDYCKYNFDLPITSLMFIIMLKTYLLVTLIGLISIYNYGKDIGVDLIENYLVVFNPIIKVEILFFITYYLYPIVWNIFVWIYNKVKHHKIPVKTTNKTNK